MTSTPTPTPAGPTLFGRIVRQLATRRSGGITSTTPAHATFAADLQREDANTAPPGTQAPRSPGASEVAIAIRSEASAVHRATRPARRAERRANQTARVQQRRTRYEERARQVLARDRTRERVREAQEHDRRSAATGYLTAWLPSVGVIVLALAMAVNDPGFVYTTLRQVFDVPTSVGMLDVTNPDVVVALAAAGATTATLLTAAHLVGKALGTLLFSAPVLNDDHPEVQRTWKDLRPARMILIISIGSAVLAWFIGFLHTIAAARFEQDVTAVFGGADRISSSVVGFITLLPVVVTAFEVVASAPQLVHARKVGRWSLQMRLAERRHIRRDQRLLERERAAHRRALLAILVLTDILKDVGRRALAEIVEAALATGRIDMSGLAGTSANNAAPRGEVEQDLLPLDLSGTTSSSYLPGLPVVSNTVAHAINSFIALGQVPVHAPLALDWRVLRDDPDSYQPHAVQDTEASQSTPQTSAADQHLSDLHRVIPAVETDATADESAA